MTLDYLELLQKCEDVYETVSFSFNQAKMVEEMTRAQADSKLWFQQQAGRITASKLRDMVHQAECHSITRSNQGRSVESQRDLQAKFSGFTYHA